MADSDSPSPHASGMDLSDDNAHYLALKARDARFDGRFFTGVTSTGIYCRPVCKVRTPKQQNCRFFALAAQAERAGFRPCMRCRPELAPTQGSAHHADCMAAWSSQDASTILALQAAQLMDSRMHSGQVFESALAVAQRLGVSERHLRRIFDAHWGVTPTQYLHTQRLLHAKQLLTDTRLPIAQVSALSGFASVKTFNTTFHSHYRMPPSALRKIGQDAATLLASHHLQVAYRPPYDVAAMLTFLQRRSIAGVELVDVDKGYLARTLALSHQGRLVVGWLSARFVPDSCSVQCEISNSLAPVLPSVLARIRALLDLDADPAPINACLEPHFPATSGLRLPGSVDGFELAVRAIVGQQITVAAARTLLGRLVQRFGQPLSLHNSHGLTHLFPSAQTLAQAEPSSLGELGIVRQRQQAIIALAQAVSDNRLDLSPAADVAHTVAALQTLSGIGAWTAQYIAMRALRWPDAFPAGDVAIHNALGLRAQHTASQAAKAAQERSLAWRPWRSYAVLRIWAGLAA